MRYEDSIKTALEFVNQCIPEGKGEHTSSYLIVSSCIGAVYIYLDNNYQLINLIRVKT